MRRAGVNTVSESAWMVTVVLESTSRRSRRPACQPRALTASALLAAAEDGAREFDVVVVGEYERAFHGDQFREVVARLNGLGVHVGCAGAT